MGVLAIRLPSKYNKKMIELEKNGTRLSDTKLMKTVFDNIVNKEPKCLNDIIKELCSYDNIVITDIDTSTQLLKSRKQIFIYFYSTNNKSSIESYDMIMTITARQVPDNEGIIVESMKLSDKQERSFTVTF